MPELGDDPLNPDGSYAKYFGECLGVSPPALKGDSDWALIIKLHAYIEASLNFLILRHFNDPRLEGIISLLDVSDRRKEN